MGADLLAVVLTETHIATEIEESETYIQGYNSFKQLSESRHTGRVTIVEKREVKCEGVGKFSVDKENWCIIIKVQINDESVIIGGIYRSPSERQDRPDGEGAAILLRDNIVYKKLALQYTPPGIVAAAIEIQTEQKKFLNLVSIYVNLRLNISSTAWDRFFISYSNTVYNRILTLIISVGATFLMIIKAYNS
ncbi:hypothetical protein HHI36_001868 [Cryptolaemus montrouzieri]|uniref:RING-type E3 ubiquitin transferase n=1 Tax=Cryptolaemus montrouzieri TaxID=559131 RepID=A0ABD2P998_9CUCU